MAEWIELKIQVDLTGAEILATYLQEIGGQGAVIHDPRDVEKVKELDYLIWKGEEINQDSSQAEVTTYFDINEDMEEIEYLLDEKMDQLRQLELLKGSVQLSIEEVRDDEWFSEFEKHYEPIQLSRYLSIQPAKKKAKLDPHQPMPPVILDPGIAFGTGQHPTTILAMLALEYSMVGGESVLDVGAGSGVLTITAGRLGAKDLSPCDIDEQALASTQHNLELNHMQAQVFPSDLLAAVEGEYDIIVANIVAKFIIQLLPQVSQHLKAGGRLIVSGILEEKREGVLQAIQDEGFEIDLSLQKEDWLAFVLHKREEE